MLQSLVYFLLEVSKEDMFAAPMSAVGGFVMNRNSADPLEALLARVQPLPAVCYKPLCPFSLDHLWLSVLCLSMQILVSMGDQHTVEDTAHILGYSSSADVEYGVELLCRLGLLQRRTLG